MLQIEDTYMVIQWQQRQR